MALTASGTPSVITGTRAKGGEPFIVTGYATDASTAAALKAAPGANKSLVIDYAQLGVSAATTIAHIQDEDGNILFGPLITATETGVMTKPVNIPTKVASNKAIQLKAAAAGSVSVYIEGRIIDDPE